MNTAKEKLKEIRKLDKAIEYKLEVAEDLRTGKFPCINMDKIGRNGTFVSNPTMRLTLKIVKLSEQIDRDIAYLCELKHDLENILRSNLNAQEYEICYLRYFKYKSWEEIAVLTSYSIRGVYRIHGSALSKLNDVL